MLKTPEAMVTPASATPACEICVLWRENPLAGRFGNGQGKDSMRKVVQSNGPASWRLSWRFVAGESYLTHYSGQCVSGIDMASRHG